MSQSFNYANENLMNTVEKIVHGKILHYICTNVSHIIFLFLHHKKFTRYSFEQQKNIKNSIAISDRVLDVAGNLEGKRLCLEIDA